MRSPFKRTVITRGDNKPYLVRYSLFSCPWFSFKLHHILSSDDECLHDHPWSFISILLHGTYIEASDNETPGVTTYQRYKAGNLLYRAASWRHRLIIVKPVWSFVINFRKVREWGFWTTKFGFIPWYKYNQTDHCS